MRICGWRRAHRTRRIAPDYDLTDGLLDVVVVHPVPRLTLLTMFPRLASGRRFDHPAIERFRARQVVVDGPGLYGMADGEALGRPPFTCTAAPGALRVYVHEETSGDPHSGAGRAEASP